MHKLLRRVRWADCAFHKDASQARPRKVRTYKYIHPVSTLTSPYSQLRQEEQMYPAVKFICEPCNASFPMASQLAHHNERHPKMYQCNQCDKSYDTAQGLTQHVKALHEKGGEPWGLLCPVEGFQSTGSTRESLNRNIETINSGSASGESKWEQHTDISVSFTSRLIPELGYAWSASIQTWRFCTSRKRTAWPGYWYVYILNVLVRLALWLSLKYSPRFYVSLEEHLAFAFCILLTKAWILLLLAVWPSLLIYTEPWWLLWAFCRSLSHSKSTQRCDLCM